MATHVMTPARRAALRKAQLASAQRRRRGGVGAQAKRAVRQRGQYAVASTQVAARRHVGSKGFRAKAKKGLKYTAYGVAGAATIAAGTYAAKDVGRARAQGKSSNYQDQTRARMQSFHQRNAKIAKMGTKKGVSPNRPLHKANYKAHKAAARQFSGSRTLSAMGRRQVKKTGGPGFFSTYQH